VMDPFEARGFSLDYGEQDVRLNGDVSVVSSLTKLEEPAFRVQALACPAVPATT